MTLLAIVEVAHKRYPHLKKRNLALRCDECGCDYERAHLVKQALKQLTHYCSNECHDKSLNSGSISRLREQTMLTRYGVENGFQTAHAKQRAIESSLGHFGVKHPFLSKEVKRRANAETAWDKRIQTMKIRHSFGRSALEEVFGKLLAQKFILERQVRVGRWPIDFHIPSINTYIQFDGVYWHGLDRPIELIRTSDYARDRVIFKKWNTDRAQDEWFAANKKCLVRVTDVEFKEHGNAILDLLEQRIARAKGVMG